MTNPWFLEKLAKERELEFLGWGNRPIVSSPHRAASAHRVRGAIVNLMQRGRCVRRSNSGATRGRGERRREPFKLAAATERLPAPVGRGR
jgi:hypothetical protein